MLLVPVRVAPSPIRGLGVFTLEPIREGRDVWRFTPGFDLDLDPALVEAQPEPFRGRLLHYGYIDPRLRRYILCADGARSINHGEHANLRADYAGDRYGVGRAARDIDAREELTPDYRVLEGQASFASPAARIGSRSREQGG